ncbi:MAG: 8-oxo-dGTP diphosphatase [Bacilli bacterium]|nr:8-oxo-dGTP diphosphatase [Bacilli bacterium]
MNQVVPKTVLCHLKKDDCYLLLFRNKKKNDMNEGKWVGVGGHVEKGETIDQAAIREIKEETGLDVRSLRCGGEVLFINDDYQEIMYVYEITDFSGELIECNEGELKWIPIKDIYSYPMWEGDKAFLPLLINHAPYFKLELRYKNKDLVSVKNIK